MKKNVLFRLKLRYSWYWEAFIEKSPGNYYHRGSNGRFRKTLKKSMELPF